MQRVAALFLVYMLVAFPMLSIATPALSLTKATQDCMMLSTHTPIQNDSLTNTDCCQHLNSHCSHGQCDCDSFQFSHLFINTKATALNSVKPAILQSDRYSHFISRSSASPYRPPRLFFY